MRIRLLSVCALGCLLTTGVTLFAAKPCFAGPAGARAAEEQSGSATAGVNRKIDPQAWFAKGQTALQSGDLDAAEEAFRKVLVADSRAGSAYANLGVIAMRRKDWDHAIMLLHKAQKLEPKMAGIRLHRTRGVPARQLRGGDCATGVRLARPAGFAAGALSFGTLRGVYEKICRGGEGARTFVVREVQ